MNKSLTARHSVRAGSDANNKHSPAPKSHGYKVRSSMASVPVLLTEVKGAVSDLIVPPQGGPEEVMCKGDPYHEIGATDSI